jgi:hypothetical protein
VDRIDEAQEYSLRRSGSSRTVLHQGPGSLNYRPLVCLNDTLYYAVTCT